MPALVAFRDPRMLICAGFFLFLLHGDYPYTGSYLNEIHRVTAKMYFPTDGALSFLVQKTLITGVDPGISADVLKARLKTTGVVEHTFSLPKNGEFRGGVEWKIYDVGGARPQRQAWAPYFDDGEFPSLVMTWIGSPTLTLSI